jgi:TusA-related sulfurtransferase
MEPQPIQLDARGLEPPQPMMKILEAIAVLPADATLAAHTDRQPLLLYPMLEQRGFTYETLKQSDGSHLTHIRRR